MTNDVTIDIKEFIEFLKLQKLDGGKTKLLESSLTGNMLFKYFCIYSKGKSIWTFEKSMLKTLISFRIFSRISSGFQFSQSNYEEFLKLMGVKE